MRLLLVSQDFPPAVGGVQTYSLELARHLARSCEALHVVAPFHPDAHSVDATLPVPVHRVRCSSDALFARAIPTVAALARRERLDTALHGQWMTALASMVARPAGGPERVFVAAHGRELLLRPGGPAAGRVYAKARERALQGADGVLAVSRYTAALVRGLGVSAGRVHVVPNGTDPTRFTPRPIDDDGARRFRARHGLEGRRVVLTLGRLVPHKGVDTTIAAIARLRRRHRDVVLAIAGGGPDRPRLEALVRTLDAGDQVRFLGRIDDAELGDCFAACEVFATLSRERVPDVEGFGVVFLEAAACGRPTLGARTVGSPTPSPTARPGSSSSPTTPRRRPPLSTGCSPTRSGRRAWEGVGARAWNPVTPGPPLRTGSTRNHFGRVTTSWCRPLVIVPASGRWNPSGTSPRQPRCGRLAADGQGSVVTMDSSIQTLDLHVHSKHSGRFKLYVLSSLEVEECYTEPVALHDACIARGMSMVTITDHDTIDGCLEIAHLGAHVFLSEEVSARFPENGCIVHVLVYGIDEGHHREIQRLRTNIYELVAYLRRERILHSLAHPFSVGEPAAGPRAAAEVLRAVRHPRGRQRAEGPAPGAARARRDRPRRRPRAGALGRAPRPRSRAGQALANDRAVPTTTLASR